MIFSDKSFLKSWFRLLQEVERRLYSLIHEFQPQHQYI